VTYIALVCGGREGENYVMCDSLHSSWLMFRFEDPWGEISAYSP